MRSRFTPALLAIEAILVLGYASPAFCGEDSVYEVTDPRLQMRLIDTSENESYLSIRPDTEGQLFVGAREALFVYEPDGEGGFREKVELYRFPAHTWIYDVAFRGDDLYVSTATTLYLLPGARVKRTDLTVKPLLWGIPAGSIPTITYGVHQGMHGLAWGPEGDLYISFGDPLYAIWARAEYDHWDYWNFYLSDGTEVPYNGVGGIIRLRPDGTQFQVVANGLRNPCGLAFDNQWNLFSHDNDHESRPDYFVPSRLLYVNPGCDFSWPRGWLLTKSPDRYDLLLTMNQNMGRSVPVGQSYYGESLLPTDYQDSILLARWGQRTLSSYQKEPMGATFRAEEKILLQCAGIARPVGVAVGVDGRIYALVCHMHQNDASPVYRSDILVIEPIESANPSLSPINLVELDTEALYKLLESESWELQQSAHVEILRRPEALAEATTRLNQGTAPPHSQNLLIHLSAAQNSNDSKESLVALAENECETIRIHAIRALSHLQDQTLAPLFVKAIGDPSPAVRLAAIEGLSGIGEVPEELIQGPACSEDTYLRQAAVRVMEDHLSIDRLAELASAPLEKQRLAAALAIGRRLTVPRTNFLPPEDFTVTITGYGTQINLDHEVFDLLSDGHRVGHYTTSSRWHGIPHTELEERQFQLLSERLGDESEAVRLQAAHYLSLLRDERTEQAIKDVREAATTSRLAQVADQPITELWIAGPFEDAAEGLNRTHPPEMGAVSLDAKYPQGDGFIEWQQAASETGDFTQTLVFETASASYYTLFDIQSANKQKIWINIRSAGHGAGWQNGQNIWLQHQRPVERTEDRLEAMLQPGTNTFLIRIHAEGSPAQYSLSVRALENVIISAPLKSEGSLADRLRDAIAAGGQPLGEEFVGVDWAAEVENGDAVIGRALFTSIGCIKCHAISNDFPVIGAPSLADASRRFTAEYIAESVLMPSNKVSDLFNSTTIITADGLIVSGLILSETAEYVEIIKPDAERVRINIEDIDERHASRQSPMPQGLVKTPQELIDLVSYLLAPDS